MNEMLRSYKTVRGRLGQTRSMRVPASFALTVASALLLATGASAAQLQTYHVRFAAVVGSKPFRCGESYAGIGRDRATISAEYFRFYVSGIALIDAGGRRVPLALQQDGVWQRRDVAFLGFEDPGTKCANGSPQEREEVIGSAPAGRYAGIEFTLGIPGDLDHADATIAESPLNLTDMFWSWRGGYKFLRFDGRVTDGNGTNASYIFHLGSTGCTLSNGAASCMRSNLETIVLDGFDPSKNAIVADLASLFKNADLAALARGGGCMSSPDDACQPVMRDLGIAFGGQAGGTQALFRVR
jgi:uncharacterized repeat protein (TIGR04052 family)